MPATVLSTMGYDTTPTLIAYLLVQACQHLRLASYNDTSTGSSRVLIVAIRPWPLTA